METTKEKFSVIALDTSEPGCKEWCHWAEGLSVIIRKGNTTIALDSDEIQKVVKALPRTFGGSY